MCSHGWTCLLVIDGENNPRWLLPIQLGQNETQIEGQQTPTQSLEPSIANLQLKAQLTTKAQT